METAIARAESDTDCLYERAKAGDQLAWRILFDTCYPKIIRAVRRRLTSPSLRAIYDSADFAHDVWHSLAAKSDRFHFESVEALMAFLSKAVQRKVIDADRRQAAIKHGGGQVAHAIDQPSAEPPSPDPTPSQYAQADESWHRIVRGLTDTQRQIVRLKRENHDTETIARMVGWQRKKVQRFLHNLYFAYYRTGGPQ